MRSVTALSTPGASRASRSPDDLVRDIEIVIGSVIPLAVGSTRGTTSTN